MKIATRMLAVVAAIALGLPTSAVYAHGGNASLIHACDLSNSFAYIVGPNQTCNLGGSAVHWNIQGLKGDKGLTGATGLQGLPGVDGTDGTDGAVGPKGDKGDPGVAGVNGTNGLDGAPGLKGDTGDVGQQGPPGVDAPIPSTDCPLDSVRSGPSCIDMYEASVWETTDAALIKKIRDGTVTLADLQTAGAAQRGYPHEDPVTGLANAGCLLNGAGCLNFYAVSIPGVLPVEGVSWFQAAAIARNSGKRLPTSAEWQVAALGTPDNGVCNTGDLALTGGRALCISDIGVYDMVLNAGEHVADWARGPGPGDVCHPWDAPPPLSDGTGDINCFGGVTGNNGAVSMIRGGPWHWGASGGVYTISAQTVPQAPNAGFRAIR